ncbi:nitroreductase family deazaflavin-dependent oxidoreductase [uncultured Pseudokineococcus sp.]|uniref:nitroreductase family deazaflavin-dependent oxidoreductase n=1 Tax=uncultured Pseudokineococcus sp. TaxID=1642928 RepID=UPI00262AB19C|nr:nitroreductase family deazaflavin-dependent oxidoreductase [uncultured Pseudokineococcus sp.]
MRRTAVVVASAALVLSPLVVVVGLRMREPHVVRAVRRFNRDVTNPRQLRVAGGPGAWASVVEHVGRRTGAARRTPVGATPVDGGLVVPLPYGHGADWVRNVLASGSAVVVRDGVRHDVDRPEVVPTAAVRACFSAADARVLRAFGVKECLLVHHVRQQAARPP